MTDSTATYCYDSSFTTDTSIGSYAMQRLSFTTDMSISYHSACWGSGTDVHWIEADLAGSTRGTRICTFTSMFECYSNDLKLDIAQIDIGDYDWNDRRKTAVHELGHAVGLGHDNGSINAMREGDVTQDSPTNSNWQTFTSHDVGHINAWY